MPLSSSSLGGVSSRSTITCPACGHAAAEDMLTVAPQLFHDCGGCGTTLAARPGDCCVFCSYGDVPCPAAQLEQRHLPRTA